MMENLGGNGLIDTPKQVRARFRRKTGAKRGSLG